VRAAPGALGLLLAALAVPAPGAAQSVLGPQLLQNPATVRAAGLGGAGAALMGDAGAVFTNPAGLALIHGVAVEAGYHGAPFDAYQASGALGIRIGQLDVGVGLQHFDYGSEAELVPDPATGGVTGLPTGARVSARELLASGTLIYRLGLLAFGGTVKTVDQRVADLRARGVSGDLGIAIAFFDLAAFGFSIQNVSGNWERGSTMVLPRLTRLGFTMNYVDPQETYRLLSTVELQWPEAASTRVVLGVEGGAVVQGVGVLARGAYGSRPADAALSRFTAGLSITFGTLTVDYAYTPTALLGGGEQRIGLRLGL
jgi:hypothetical protein